MDSIISDRKMMIKTSIIILSYNTLNYTKLCIESIRKHTPLGIYEIIVVDNGSIDGSREWLKRQSDVVLIKNIENLGFPKGCNQGMKVATGQDLLLLNSDTIVTPRWLENMQQALHSDDTIGAVGCVANRVSHFQQVETNGYQSLEELIQFAEQYNRSNPELWEERLTLVGFAFLLKREVYERIGPMDENFSPGNYEDDDYSLRIWQAGWKLLLCKDTFIHHFGSASFLQNRSEEEKKKKEEKFLALLKRNKEYFLKKWNLPNEYWKLNPRDIFKV